MAENIIPWIQLNNPFTTVRGDPDLPGLPGIVHAVVGAELFQTDSLIVTAVPKHYTRWGFLPDTLTSLVPMIEDDDGSTHAIKTIYGIVPPVGRVNDVYNGSPNSMWDLDGWTNSLMPAIKALHDAEQTTILLDLEGPFRAGDYNGFDFNFFEVVELLATVEVEYWFNLPRVLPDTGELPQRLAYTRFLLRELRRLNAKFFDASVAYKEADEQGRQWMLDAVGKDKIIDRIMVGDSLVTVGNKTYYPIAEAKAELETREGTQILWTGQEHFVRVARQWNV